jgi:hypothetical protein
MESVNETSAGTEKLHQEINMLREGLKKSIKNNEDSHKLVKSLEKKLSEHKEIHSNVVRDLETKIWNYQIEIDKYKEGYKKLKFKHGADTEKTLKPLDDISKGSNNLSNQFEVFVACLKNNLDAYQCFKAHFNCMKKFQQLVDENNYYHILKKLLPFVSEIIGKYFTRSSTDETSKNFSYAGKFTDRNDKLRDSTTNRILTHGLKNFQCLVNPIYDKKTLKNISDQQNIKLLQISKEISEIVSAYSHIVIRKTGNQSPDSEKQSLSFFAENKITKNPSTEEFSCSPTPATERITNKTTQSFD